MKKHAFAKLGSEKLKNPQNICKSQQTWMSWRIVFIKFKKAPKGWPKNVGTL